MINISDRLKAIALEIFTGETMADIGTDHGFLPVYLWERRICPHVVMADISKGSLAKARETCSLYHPGENFDIRLGSGLEVLENGEVDDIVIAGMGGLLMVEIFQKDMIKTKSFKKYILQPRSAVGPLRHWLFHNGFTVEEETLVREGKFICEILTAIPKREKVVDFEIMNEPADSIKWEVPSWLMNKEDGNDLIEDYLTRKLSREEKILKEMKKGKNTDTESVIKKIEYLKSLLEV